MATKGYNSYHGRTPLWKKILIPILVLLLLAGGAFLYCQNHLVYDENGKVITGYELSSVITITIDGNEIESCGDTCIFVQKGLTPDVDFTTETIQSSGSVLDITSLSAKLNQYKNKFGKARVVVIKSQLGNPIMAFSGDSVYWEIPEDLPKMTKLMIDGKALYIHRANFQIIDKELIE